MLQFADGSHSATILHIFPVLCSWLRVEDLQSLNLAWHWCENLPGTMGFSKVSPPISDGRFYVVSSFAVKFWSMIPLVRVLFWSLPISPRSPDFFHSKLGLFWLHPVGSKAWFPPCSIRGAATKHPCCGTWPRCSGWFYSLGRLSLMVLRWPMWFLSLDQVPNGFSVIITIYPFWWASAGSRSIQF